MNKCMLAICVSVLVLLSISGCISTQAKDPTDIFVYKDSYVGDAGAVGNITSRLPDPNGESLNGLELKTSDQPYGIILNYVHSDTNNELNNSYQEVAVYNASALFALVKNVDWITFNFIYEEDFHITRDDIDTLFPDGFSDFTSEEELSRYLSERLAVDSSIYSLFD